MTKTENISSHAPTFLVYFFDETRLHEDEVKLPKARTSTYDDEFSSPFLNLDWVLKNSIPGKMAYI